MEEEHSATPDMLMAKSSAKAHRSCLVQMKVMWHFAESTIKRENCGSRIVTLTKRLARANITSVMNDERRKQTEQKLIRSGRAEFLEKGYAKANLRDICKAAGVTTGAFYFSFENKEALLAAILEPVIADYQRMCSVFAKREIRGQPVRRI